MRITRRPKPSRSGKPGCAPTATPFALQVSTVRSIVTGSEAWKPQATFALVIAGMSASSSPIRQLPKLSPQSELMSIVLMAASIRPAATLPRVRVEGTREFAASREDVFRALTDPHLIAESIPLVRSVQVDDPDRWSAEVRVPLGCRGPRIRVRVDVLERREPEH